MKPQTKPPPPPKDLIFAPSYLSDMVAKTEYVRIIRELGQGNVKPVDQSLIADYAKSFARVLELEKRVRDCGETAVGPKGGEYIHPNMNLLLSERAHLAALRRDLFFTPKSRGTGSQPTGKAKGILERLREQEQEGQQ